jgi:large subunit ribosomal protein L10
MHPEKANIVAELHAKLNASPFLFVADYTGLKVSQFSELRNRLWATGSRCHVVKNSFLRLAVKDAGLPELTDLRGQTAIIVGEKDVAAAAKVLKTFTAEFKKPTLKAGLIDGLPVGSAEIQAIADLPSREVLLATLLGVLQAPASKLVRVLNEPASALARVLQARADQAAQTDQAAPPEPEAAAA